MTLPKITIITPSYNQGKYIEQTITSILDQDYPNLEYIIIDGGSTDETVDIIKKYADKITYWVSEPDDGQAHAINKGLEKASGDLVNWINSDDYLEPGALHYIGTLYNKTHFNILFTHTRCFYEKSNDQFINYFEIKKNLGETIVFHSINQPGTFIKTKCLTELAGINEALNFSFDLELYMRYFLKYGLNNSISDTYITTSFRLHSKSKTVKEQIKFTEEENEIWYYFLTTIGKNRTAKFFYNSSNPNYNTNCWPRNNKIEKEIFYNLGRKYFYDIYKSNKRTALSFYFILLKNKFFKSKLQSIKILYHLLING
jgi:glycosyltransferase involved in cell wall biosynthesis